jgi:hypothetical protein
MIASVTFFGSHVDVIDILTSIHEMYPFNNNIEFL